MKPSHVLWEHTTPSLGDAVVAIGVFDGVHLGHQTLVADAAKDASARGIPCVALTFDRDPDQVVTPDSPGAQLLTLADKCTFLGEAGADTVLVIPFDVHIASMGPDEFVTGVLMRACSPVALHVGDDFRFGRFAEGTVATLEQLGADHGFSVVGHELVCRDAAPVTSTRIRELVSRGELAAARSLLGRAHRVTGTVVKGRGEGRTVLGIPTANLMPSEHAALPTPGVYAGRAHGAQIGSYRAAISVGVAPTFPRSRDVLEAHLIGFEGDLLHQVLVLEFDERLRGQRAFESVEDLAETMRSDIEYVRRLGSDEESR